MPGRYQRPVTPAERERRDQAAAEKLSALHDRLAEQVAALRTGEDWRRWLDLARRFSTYSFGNVLLIAAQRPDATAVAGYEAWKTLGRQVDKGERGIQILAPVLRRAHAGEDTPGGVGTDTAEANRTQRARAAGTGSASAAGAPSGAGNDAGEKERRGRAGQVPREVTGFRVTYVWDVAQTSGEPLPDQPRPQLLRGQAPAGLWNSLTGLVAERGFTLERGDCGTANGLTDYATRTVRVRGDLDDAQAVKTLAHELGHVLLHDPADFLSGPPSGASSPSNAGTAHGTTLRCRGAKEVEAESVAYLVATSHGLDTEGYTFAYVTGWAASVDRERPEQVVRDTGQRVLSAARTVREATAPEASPTADSSLATRVSAGAERTAAAREHAETTLILTSPPTVGTRPQPAVTAAQAEALAQVHSDSAAFYTAQLHADTPDAARARALLEHRAIPPAAAAGYEFGYAPPGWTALTDHLRGRGWTDTQLLDAGVGMTTSRGTVVDRFRDRLMLPVRDAGGERVVGFLGRAVADAEGVPKYLNSPDTALYRKGEVLYGLGAGPGRQAFSAGVRPVLVEGPLDAIAVTAAGNDRYAGVAPCGTALTPAQVAALDRSGGPLARRGVVVAFDSDPGGRDAALRAFDLLRTTGAWPSAAVLPDGHDPASLAQAAGPGALCAALDAARPLADLVVDEHLARWSDRLHWVEGRTGALREAAQLLATFPAEQVGRQVARLADRLGLEHATVTGAVVEAVSRDEDAARDAWGRLARRNRSDDLDGGQLVRPVSVPPPAAQLARVGYPSPLHGVSLPATGAVEAGTGHAGPSPAFRQHAGGRPGNRGAR